jgi:anti-anti-sigma factor
MAKLVRGSDDAFCVSTEVRGDRAQVRLVGELDALTEHHVREALQMLAEHGIRHFRIDASGLTFVGSSGVRVIVELLAKHPACVITLVGASPIYLRMLSATGVDAHLALLQGRSDEPRPATLATAEEGSGIELPRSMLYPSP